MQQPLSALVRRATIAGAPAGDVRFVVTADGRAAIINRNAQGGFQAVISATGATWRAEADGRITVDAPGGPWSGIRDTRCGSCAGRYELRMVNAEQFLPHIEEAPDGPDLGEAVPAPAYGDTY